MPGYAISKQQNRKLSRILAALSRQTDAEALVVCDYGGNILGEVSRLSDHRLQTVAALAAGAFAATRELAQQVGEASFQSLYHQGTAINIYIHCQISEFLLLLVLKSDTPQGLAKLYVEKVSRLLAPILVSTLNQSAVSAGLSEQFECDSEAFMKLSPSSESTITKHCSSADSLKG
jgi:predicted regulator of Ras-like GTPase activity (Roadblock/LC7/MglB family)